MAVQVAGGLVSQDDSGLGDQRPGDGHPLLLAAGEVAGIAGQLALQIQKAHDLPEEGLVLLLAVQTDGEDDVLIGSEVGDQVVILKDETDPLAAEDGEVLVPKVLQLEVVHLHGAAGGPVQPAQHVQQGGLAGAGGADDGHELPRLYGQGDVVQGLHQAGVLTILLGQVGGLQDTHKRFLPFSVAGWSHGTTLLFRDKKRGLN